jgi:essential nuclear protein 1
MKFNDPKKIILDPKTSKRIFELAKDQQEELNVLADKDDDSDPDVQFVGHRTHTSDDDDEDEDESNEENYGEDADEVFVSVFLSGESVSESDCSILTQGI